jgi:hypothetical protein
VAIGVGELKGVTAELATALHAMGIVDIAQLLAAAGQYAVRAELAATLEIDDGTLLEFVNRADLMRIPGLTGDYIDLLMLAGVATVVELRRRIPENLYVKLLTVTLQHPPPYLPRLDEVQQWVRTAKQLERAVYY